MAAAAGGADDAARGQQPPAEAFRESDCVICLCPLDDRGEDNVSQKEHIGAAVKELTVLKCGHVYHTVCVANIRGDRCPTCRMKLSDLGAEDNRQIDLTKFCKTLLLDNPSVWKYCVTREKLRELEEKNVTLEKYVKKKAKLYRATLMSDLDAAQQRCDRKMKTSMEAQLQTERNQAKPLLDQGTLLCHGHRLRSGRHNSALGDGAADQVLIPEGLGGVIPEADPSHHQLIKYATYFSHQRRQGHVDERTLLLEVDNLRSQKGALADRRAELGLELRLRRKEKASKRHEGEHHGTAQSPKAMVALGTGGENSAVPTSPVARTTTLNENESISEPVVAMVVAPSSHLMLLSHDQHNQQEEDTELEVLEPLPTESSTTDSASNKRVPLQSNSKQLNVSPPQETGQHPKPQRAAVLPKFAPSSRGRGIAGGGKNTATTSAASFMKGQPTLWSMLPKKKAGPVVIEIADDDEEDTNVAVHHRTQNVGSPALATRLDEEDSNDEEVIIVERGKRQR